MAGKKVCIFYSMMQLCCILYTRVLNCQNLNASELTSGSLNSHQTTLGTLLCSGSKLTCQRRQILQNCPAYTNTRFGKYATQNHEPQSPLATPFAWGGSGENVLTVLPRLKPKSLGIFPPTTHRFAARPCDRPGREGLAARLGIFKL